MLKTKQINMLVALLVIASMVIAACGAPAAAPASDSDGATAADSGDAAMDDGEISRAETLFVDANGRREDPELWNPYVPGDKRSFGYHQSVSEPLFILNYESGEIEGWLGEGMTANDTLDVWTMTLREGIEWSDGEALDANDVMFTMNMLLDNAPELNNSADLANWIESVEMVDDRTVTFNLTDPNPRFQLDYFSVKIWGGINIVPQHIWEGEDPLTFKFFPPIGSGAYTFASATETEAVFVRNDDWWGAKVGWQDMPAPKQLIWADYGPEETRVAAAADGEMDSLQDITLGAFQALQASTDDAFVAWVDGPPYAWLDPCARSFEMNLEEGHWTEPDMRWALNYYIDRDQVVDIAYENTTIKSEHFFVAYPPLNAYVDLLRDNDLFNEMQTTDAAKADALLEGQGWAKNDDGMWEKDGEVLGMQITTHESYIEKQRIAQVLVEQFQANGIDAVHLNEAGGTWGDNFAMGSFDTRMAWHTCGSINEPWASMDQMSTRWLEPIGERASNNEWRWQGENAEAYSALVEEMGTLSLDDPKVEELFLEAMDYYLTDLPVIPITQARKLIPFDTTYWTNWPTQENNYFYPANWWHSTHKIIHEVQPAQ